MHHLIYSSSATCEFTDADLQELLTKARINNEQLHVTGILLYHEGQFMQLLEGEAAVLSELYKVIEQDPRHAGVLKLADKSIVARSFPDWAMAFKPVKAAAFEQLQGYRPPASVEATPDGLSGADAMLLNMMRNFMLADE